MAVLATNQNRHFYVAKQFVADVDETSAVGDIAVKIVEKDDLGKEIYFVVKGFDTPLRSDRIDLNNLDYVKAVKAQDLRVALKKIKVTLDPNVNGGDPIKGQNYILRVVLRQFYGASDADEYVKDAVVCATEAMTTNVTLFYQAMAEALKASFAREIGATKQSNPYLEFSADANGVYLMEKPQSWIRGKMAQERVYFEVQPTTVYSDGVDVFWNAQDPTTGKYYTDLTPTDKSSLVLTGANITGIGNGKKIADIEWFCMGERGDMTHGAGWPNGIDHEYLVDPSLEYNVLELHFAYRDKGVNSYRSDKDITIVSPTASVINSIVSFIQTKLTTAITIDPIS